MRNKKQFTSESKILHCGINPKKENFMRKTIRTQNNFLKKCVSVLGFIAIAAVIGFAFAGCDDGGDDGMTDITYTAAANNAEDTTAINLTFASSVTGLSGNDITITNGTGNVTKGTLTGSGTSWAIAVTVNTAGNVTVSINKEGIESGSKNVAVGKSGGGSGITYTATADNAANTTAINLVFAGSVQLEEYDINITDITGNVTMETLTGSGTEWVVGITVNTAGDVSISINKEGIESGNKTVAVGKNILDITYTAEVDNEENSTMIYFEFASDIAELSADDITITNGTGTAVKGILEGSYNYWYLKIIVNTPGDITISINKEGIESGSKTLSVANGALAFTLINNGTEYSVSIGTLSAAEVVIPATYEGLPVTMIGYKGFYKGYYDSKITGITIPDSVTEIGDEAFWGCELKEIIIPDSVIKMGWAFNNGAYTIEKFTLPVIGLSFRDFNSCEIETVEITGSKDIPDNYFKSCEINKVIIGDSVENIGDYAFDSNSKIKEVTIGNSVKTIGKSAFYRCSNLTEITIPGSVVSIGYGAFYGCSSLTEITIPGNVETIGDIAFWECSELTKVTIENEVIGGAMFALCAKLSEVIITGNVKIIAGEAFYDCTGLTSIIIPDSVTEIGYVAFFNTGLSEITIPALVEKIGNKAFIDCKNLISVTFEGDSITFGESFNYGEEPIHFPGDLVTKFQAGGAGTYTRTVDSDIWTKN